ncbi:MAG: hypothetical protein HYV09_40310 [Deltaproteobacteria bacterium]|nr:hypothetical protein [Deltaproteobacteria bacterium]
MAASRRPSSRSLRLRPTPAQEEVLVSTSPPKPTGVAELLRRLGELESKLESSEREHASDAELVGNLLAEVAERDRRLRALAAQAEADGDRIRALEIASQSFESSDVQPLEEALSRDEALFAELLRRLAARHGNDRDVPSELHDLLAATLGALDAARVATGETNTKVAEIRAAIRGGPEVDRALGQTLARGEEAAAALGPVDRAIARVVERLRDIERQERELEDSRTRLLEDAAQLIETVRGLGAALGRAVTPAERPRPPRRRPSLKLRR